MSAATITPAAGQQWIVNGDAAVLRRQVPPFDEWVIEWLGSGLMTSVPFDPETWVPLNAGAQLLLFGLLVEVDEVYVDGLDLSVVRDGEPDSALGFMMDPEHYQFLRSVARG